MTATVLLCIALTCVASFGGQRETLRSLGEVKKWTFDLDSGDVTVKLSRVQDGTRKRLALSLEPQAESTPKVTQEAEFLRQVLDDMASLGHNAGELTMITTWLQNSEYRDGVERAVTSSGVWRSCGRRKYCHEAEPVANRYLENVGAFSAFDAILAAHGLRRRSVRVDDMAVGEKSSRVLCSGSIVIALERRGAEGR